MPYYHSLSLTNTHFPRLPLCFYKKSFCRFEKLSKFAPLKTEGAIAQLVEHRTENPGVPGSIPGGTTFWKVGVCRLFVLKASGLVSSLTKVMRPLMQ